MLCLYISGLRSNSSAAHMDQVFLINTHNTMQLREGSLQTLTHLREGDDLIMVFSKERHKTVFRKKYSILKSKLAHERISFKCQQHSERSRQQTSAISNYSGNKIIVYIPQTLCLQKRRTSLKTSHTAVLCCVEVCDNVGIITTSSCVFDE